MKRALEITLSAALALLLTIGFALSQAHAIPPNGGDAVRESPTFGGLSGYLFEFLPAPNAPATPTYTGLMMFVGGAGGKEIRNLTPQRPAEPGQPVEVTLDDFREGFAVSRAVGLNISAGPSHYITITQALGSLGNLVGLIPIAGTKAVINRIVQTPEQIEPETEIDYPSNPDFLAGWGPHDSMLMQVTGGVLFTGQLGAGFYASIGARYVATGDWYVTLRRLPDGLIHLQFTKKKLHSLAGAVGTVMLALEVSTFGTTDSSFSFTFDPRSEQARAAYREALHGSLSAAESLATDADSGVRRVATTRMDTRGRHALWFVGVPALLYGYRTDGRYHALSRTQHHEDGSELEIRSAAVVHEKAVGGFLLNAKSTRNDFYATHVTAKAPNGEARTTYGGEFVWSYENAKADPRHYRERLDTMLRQTGLSDQIRLVLPPPKKKIGYLQSSLHVNLSQALTDRLLALGEGDPDHTIERTIEQQIQSYFALGDTDNLCGSGAAESAPKLERCRAEQLKESKKAARAMLKSLRKMTRAREAEPERFVREFADFGEHLLTNRFTFRGILSMASEDEVQTEFVLEGRRVSRFVQRIDVRDLGAPAAVLPTP